MVYSEMTTDSGSIINFQKNNEFNINIYIEDKNGLKSLKLYKKEAKEFISQLIAFESLLKDDKE